MALEAYLGSIHMFGGNFAPRGYAFCQGQLMSISQNSALFSLLGTTYGGNGQTNFALPDLRGRAPVGQGPGLGLNPVDIGQMSGAASVTLLTTNMPAHTHATTVTINAAADGRPGSTSPAGSVLDSMAGTTNFYAAAPDGRTTMNVGMATAQVAPAGDSLPFSVQNPFIGINFIICTQGVFPSRN